jgi:hypothetical protein
MELRHACGTSNNQSISLQHIYHQQSLLQLCSINKFYTKYEKTTPITHPLADSANKHVGSES